MEGDLYSAPIKNPQVWITESLWSLLTATKDVLDVGTGTGIWAMYALSKSTIDVSFANMATLTISLRAETLQI